MNKDGPCNLQVPCHVRSSKLHGSLICLQCSGLSQFTCDNGVCIDLKQRCNGIRDCTDISDEENCKILTIDESKYRKSSYPPPLNDTHSGLELNIGVWITSVDNIDELESVYRIKFQTFVYWNDKRLLFSHLHGFDGLDSDTAQKVWIPNLLLPQSLGPDHIGLFGAVF